MVGIIVFGNWIFLHKNECSQNLDQAMMEKKK